MKRKYAAFLLLPLSLWAAANPNFSELNRALKGAQPENISPTPIDGLYQFNLGPDVLYISKDGRYLIQGEIMDLHSKTNLTEKMRATLRQKTLAAMNPKDMIIYSPKDKPKHTVYVFTDVDCGYCRMLHRNINQYTKRGIEIRYLSFPRSGPDSPSYYRAVSAWCAKDRKTALNKAEAGEPIEPLTCANAPVRKQYEAGILMGVSGTPAIILEDGTLVPGFVRPDNLLELLERHTKVS